eukprot:Trichotokara_eunicae@DN6279_c2_g1_i1.p1
MVGKDGKLTIYVEGADGYVVEDCCEGKWVKTGNEIGLCELRHESLLGSGVERGPLQLLTKQKLPSEPEAVAKIFDFLSNILNEALAKVILFGFVGYVEHYFLLRPGSNVEKSDSNKYLQITCPD